MFKTNHADDSLELHTSYFRCDRSANRYFSTLQQNLYMKSCRLQHSRIRTRILGLEGMHADHLSTTAALYLYVYLGFMHFGTITNKTFHSDGFVIFSDSL